MTEKDRIDSAHNTVELKRRLMEIRNEALDYLIDNEPDEKIYALLEESEKIIEKWVGTYIDYLVKDDSYYTKIAWRIMEPVTATLSSRNGDYDGLTEELERLEIENSQLTGKVEQLRSNVNHYYGSFGGCSAWEAKQ